MVYAIIAVLAVIAVTAVVIGLVKGFTRTKTWATEYAFAAAISIIIFTVADLSEMNDWLAFALKALVPAALAVAFAILSNRTKALIVRAIEKSQKRSYYLQYGAIEQNKLEILDAVELNDNKSYKRLSKRKFKYKRGPAGVADRILGAFTVFIKTAVLLGAIALTALVIADLSGLSFFQTYLGSVYESGVWNFFSKIVMDLLVVSVIFSAIRAGYRTGAFRALWGLAVTALICGSSYIIYGNLSAYSDIAEKLTSWLGEKVSFLAEIDITVIAEGIIASAVFAVVSAIFGVVGTVVGNAISRAREGKAFGIADGVIGGVVACAAALAILLVLGGLLWSMSGSEFLNAFNSYMFHTSNGTAGSSAIASAFYNNNPINNFGWFENLPFYSTYSTNVG